MNKLNYDHFNTNTVDICSPSCHQNELHKYATAVVLDAQVFLNGVTCMPINVEL